MVRIRELRAYITTFSKGLENLAGEVVPDPIVQLGEAKIKILAGSVNPSDVKNIQGKMDGTILPRIPGGMLLALWSMDQPNLLGTEVWGTGGGPSEIHDPAPRFIDRR
jgi:NADPH:quinone reductase-like Zn-dependent oxidoreductase